MATKMEIKKATTDDANILAELCSEIQAIHTGLKPHIFRTPSHQELVDLFKERISDPDYTAFLAFDMDEPVGYTVLHLIRKPGNVLAYERKILEIDHIHIVEKCRRRGFCKKLFAKALEVARSLEIKDIQLGVWAQNGRAVAAFNALGFKQQWAIMSLENTGSLESGDSTL